MQDDKGTISFSDSNYDYQIYLESEAETEKHYEYDQLINDEGICKVIGDDFGKKLALEKMNKYLYIYVLGESLKDYALVLSQNLTELKEYEELAITNDEKNAIDSSARIHCDKNDLDTLYKILINLPDKYEQLASLTYGDQDQIVIFQLEHVNGYVKEHFDMFRNELVHLKNSKQYYERKNFYKNLSGKAELMVIYFEWFENLVCKTNKLDEHYIRDKLNTHLKWVVQQPID